MPNDCMIQIQTFWRKTSWNEMWTGYGERWCSGEMLCVEHKVWVLVMERDDGLNLDEGEEWWSGNGYENENEISILVVL